MNCEKFQDLLKPFSDGELQGDVLRQVREHILACAHCRDALSAEDLMEVLPSIDETIEPSENFSSGFYARLESRIREGSKAVSAQPVNRKKRAWLPGWSLQLAAAACLLIVVVAAGFHFRAVSPVPDPTAVMYEIEVTENLALLKDMPMIEDLEFFEDLETIENLSQVH